MGNLNELKDKLEEGLAELETIESFFEVRGLPVPPDARASMDEKRERLREQLARLADADREE